MTFEAPQSPENAYESMDFDQLQADPIAGPVLQEVALEYLKTQDREYFEREFTGELDEDGYLIPKGLNHNSNTKPSHNIGSAGMDWVMEKTKVALEKKN